MSSSAQGRAAMAHPTPSTFARLAAIAVLRLGIATAAVIDTETKVPPYSLPPLLDPPSSNPEEAANGWRERRRPELLRTLSDQVYGRFPKPPAGAPRLTTTRQVILDGRAERRDVLASWPDAQGHLQPGLRFCVVVPQHATRPVPVFVGLHLFDTSRPLPSPAVAQRIPPDTTAEEANRRAGLATTDLILRRGYAIASLDIGELAPDSTNGWSDGVLRRFLGRTTHGPPGPTETGALGVWAWGLSRFVDCARLDTDLDPARIIAIGHSRMGKAALWAAANDTRIAAVISNNSGCGGAALSRRIFGETVGIITRAFPHWFCGNFRQYADHEDLLPVDQHHLLALVAPRPLHVASAVEDRWADPTGEYLATHFASPAWNWLGTATPGLGSTNLPAPDQPVGTRVRYHLRSGRHDLTDYDWRQFLDFADQEVRGLASAATQRVPLHLATVQSARRAPFESLLRLEDAWWRSHDARTLATNILSFQSDLGDWPKNTNTTARRFDGDPKSIQGTWDNGASVGEIRFLARYRTLTGDGAAGSSVQRAISHILAAQYPSGGWPQRHPPGPGYARHITFNDDTMVGLLELLRDIASGPDFSFLEGSMRSRCLDAFRRGVEAILRCQIRINGERLVWCAQHDELTFEPRPARTFEPISLSGAESARILRFLMSLETPSPDVDTAIHAGARWFARSALHGIRWIERNGDRVVEADPTAPPLWARFYEIPSNRPIFTGRDSVVKYRVADIEAERRNGYAWYGRWGEDVAQRYARWQNARQPRYPADRTP